MKLEIVELRNRGRGRGRDRPSDQKRRSRTDDRCLICYKCQNVSHITKFCDSEQTFTDINNYVGILRPGVTEDPCWEEIPLLNLNLNQLLTEKVQCKDVTITAVIDTSAAVSVITPSLMKMLNLTLEKSDGPGAIMVNGGKYHF